MQSKTISNSGWGQKSRRSAKPWIAAALALQLVSPMIGSAALRDLATSDGSSSGRSIKVSAPVLFTVSPTLISIASAGTNGIVTINNPASEQWEISNSNPWVSVSVAARRSDGTALLTYDVSPNLSCKDRVGVFYVKDQAVTVSQKGISADYAISPSNANFPTNGGNGSFALSANCSWNVQSETDWIVVTSPSSGSDNATISFTVLANSSHSSRNGAIKIYDGNSTLKKTFSISQSAVPLSHSLDYTNAVFSSAGGASNVVLTALAAWKTETDVDWITGVSPTNGTGNATISYSVAANSSISARSGSIKIFDANSVLKQTLTIGQTSAEANYSFADPFVNFTSDGGAGSVQLRSSSSWTLQTDANWISGISPVSGVGDATIGFVVAANTSCGSRVAKIKILDANSMVKAEVSISQAGISGDFAVAYSHLLIPSSGGTLSVGLSARCGWTVQSDVPWISNLTPSTGNSSATISYTVAPNNGIERKGYIRILDASFVVQQTIQIDQTGTGSSMGRPGADSSASFADSSTTVIDAEGSTVTIGSLGGRIYLGKATADRTVLWLKWFDGVNGSPSALALDAQGNIFGAAQITGSSSLDILLTHYSRDGQRLWLKTFGKSGTSFVESLSVSHGNLNVTGSFTERINFSDAPENELSSGGSEQKFDAGFSAESGDFLSVKLF